MLLIATTTLALTSSAMGYYIYSYHINHFKETVFLKSVEYYSRTKMKYKDYLETLSNLKNEQSSIQNTNQTKSIQNESTQNNTNRINENQNESNQNNTIQNDLVKIEDIKILRNKNEIVNIDLDHFENLSWNYLSKDSLIHICYQYQNNNYRIVFSHGQNLNILTSEISWLQDGLLNEIEELDSNLIYENLHHVVNAYAGPLGDFYQDAEINQNHLGFLTSNLSEFLFSTPMSENQYNPYIKTTNVLGETETFGFKVE